MKKNKIILGAVTAMTTVAPLAAVVACGSGSSGDAIVIMSGKTQIQDQGMDFAKTFDKMDEAKKEGMPSSTHFITANGDTMTTSLATKFGTDQFPSAVSLTNATEVKKYVDKDALLAFEDPKYTFNSSGVATATVPTAEAANVALAGSHINDLIKENEKAGGHFMKSGDKIVGIPSYTESIGVIYNKDIFTTLKLSVKTGAKAADAWDFTTAPTTGHDVIYTEDLSNDHYLKLKTYINANKPSGLANAQGIVTSGKESWAFTSKVGMVATIAQAAEDAGIPLADVHMPGDTITGSSLTPDKAATDLFGQEAVFTNGAISGTNNMGYKVFSNAAKAYVANTKAFLNNNAMMDAFKAGQIALMPQGSWEEGYLNKGTHPKYGMLPLSISTTGKAKIAKDIVGYWQFAKQSVATGRSGAAAIAAQTKAVNFIWAQYLSEAGKNVLKGSMGLLNPYAPLSKPDSDQHPLLADTALAGTNTVGWGISYNKPGVGVEGFERNNTQYTEILSTYQSDSSANNLQALLVKVKSIWAPKS